MVNHHDAATRTRRVSAAVPQLRGRPRPGRARQVGFAVTAAGALAVGALTGLAAPASAADVTATFTQVGPNGGGYTSAIASNGKGTVIAGGDTSGLFRWVKDGVSWKAVNRNISVNYVPNSTLGDTYASTTERLKVAAITYVPNPGGAPDGRWYAAVGNGTSGTVLYSADDGVTWNAMAGNTPEFAGANVRKTGLPSRHPRSTGNLLAADASGTYLYAGSFSGGVWRCKLNPAATDPMTCMGSSTGGWTKIGLLPRDGDKVIHYIRSIALNTSTSVPRLYVATIDVDMAQGASATGKTGVYLVDNPATASVTSSWKSVTSPPSGIEELKYIPSVTGSGKKFLYAVGTGGIHRISTETAGVVPSFVPVQTAPVPGELSTSIGWTGVDGLDTATGSRIVVTTGVPLDQVKRRTAVLDVTESGSSFSATALTGIDNDAAGNPNVNTTPLGGGSWDLLTTRKAALLGQNEYLGSQVLVEKVSSDTPRLWIAGKQAVYRTAWTTGTFAKWDIAVKGLTNTFTYGVTQSPVGDRAVTWPDADLIAERTTSTLAAATRCAPPEVPGPSPYLRPGTAAYSTKYQSDGTLWMATGDQESWDYSAGQLWRRLPNDTTCTWILDKTLSSVVGDAKIAAFDVQGTGSSTVVTAYVPGLGLVRGTGSPATESGMSWKVIPTTGLPVFPMKDPAGAGTGVSEVTKGVSLITLKDTIVVARPAVDEAGLQGGVYVCSTVPAVATCITTPLWSQSFNYLELDPTATQTPRVLWSAAPTAVPASAKVDPNTVTTGKAGVWAIDLGKETTPIQLADAIGGPMKVVKDTSTGRVSLVVVLGHAALPKANIRRLILGSTTATWDLVQTGLELQDAGVDATGVLVTKDGPAAGTWRIYISTLGGGVMSADVTSAW